jgi:hypothetical protein
VIDATRPYEWQDKFPKVSGASRELKDKVANDWRDFLDQKVGREMIEETLSTKGLARQSRKSRADSRVCHRCDSLLFLAQPILLDLGR